MTTANEEFLDDVKAIFEEGKNAREVLNKDKYFSTNGGKVKYSIDDTFLEPTKTTLVKGLKDNYSSQLHDFLYPTSDDDTDIDEEAYLLLTLLKHHIEKGNTPITLTTSKYPTSLPFIVSEVNKFFSVNDNVITHIYAMVNNG